MGNSARINSVDYCNKFTIPSLYYVQGSLQPKELIKSEAKFNKRSEAVPSVQVCSFKVFYYFHGYNSDGCIFEVKLSINKKGNRRSGLWLG